MPDTIIRTQSRSLACFPLLHLFNIGRIYFLNGSNLFQSQDQRVEFYRLLLIFGSGFVALIQ